VDNYIGELVYSVSKELKHCYADKF